VSATDRLCELLAERGAKWFDADGRVVIGVDEPATVASFKDYDGLLLGMMYVCCTPERAIEATLGARITGDTSDGYHTFDELYHHRAVLFSVIVRDHRELAWKSKAHHDGTMYDGMFIVGIETPQGQATYHYDVDPYWDMFDCKELGRAPEWDGHTPSEAIERIATLGRPTCSLEREPDSDRLWWCSNCHTYHEHVSEFPWEYCPRCGAKVVR